MMQLKKELLHRTKAMAGGKDLKPLVVIIDDVFTFLLHQSKAVTKIFFDLLIFGAELNVHLVAASHFTYRNLLKQVMDMNPPMRRKMQFHYGCDCCQVITPVGAELVLTAEDLVFYKTKNEADYVRLFPFPETPSSLGRNLETDVAERPPKGVVANNR